MKKLLLLASIALLVSCSSDDNNNSSSIDVTGNWSFESGEIRSSEASPFIGLTQNDDLECFKMTELRINSNNTVNYSQIYFDVNEQNCLQNPIPFENFTWAIFKWFNT